MSEQVQVIPVHQWTHTGDKVLIVRQCAHDGASSRGFVYPKSGHVECPDWQDHNDCGNGLHGWPWGLSQGDGQDPNFSALWLVIAVEPQDVIDVEDKHGKVKFRRGEVVFAGEWWKASEITEAGRNAWILQAACGAASATGESGAASATGLSGAASATGLSGAASATGWRGAASATGWRGAASATGLSGAASATGWSGAAVCTGTSSKAKAGQYGMIALAWWNETGQRQEMRCSRVVDGNDGTLKPDVWYRLNESGEFVEAETAP